MQPILIFFKRVKTGATTQHGWRMQVQFRPVDADTRDDVKSLMIEQSSDASIGSVVF